MGQVLGFCMKPFPDFYIYEAPRCKKLNFNIGTYVLNHLLGRPPHLKDGPGPVYSTNYRGYGPGPIHSTSQSNQMAQGPHSTRQAK